MEFPKRNIITPNKTINLTKKYTQAEEEYKPKGLWYSCHDEWYNYVKEERMPWLKKYIHKLNLKPGRTNIRSINPNKLLVLKTSKDIDAFQKKYGVSKYGLEWIKWKKVAEDYGGIEICPYVQSRKKYMWYNTFDVASGCIWNLKLVKDTEIIYKLKKSKKGEEEYVSV